MRVRPARVYACQNTDLVAAVFDEGGAVRLFKLLLAVRLLVQQEHIPAHRHHAPHGLVAGLQGRSGTCALEQTKRGKQKGMWVRACVSCEHPSPRGWWERDATCETCNSNSTCRDATCETWRGMLHVMCYCMCEMWRDATCDTCMSHMCIACLTCQM